MMDEFSTSALIFSFLITWTIGLTPPVIIRNVFLRRSISKLPAIGICAFFWFFNFVLFTLLGSKSKSHAALGIIAMVSYYILTKPKKNMEDQNYNQAIYPTVHEPLAASGTQPAIEPKQPKAPPEQLLASAEEGLPPNQNQELLGKDNVLLEPAPEEITASANKTSDKNKGGRVAVGVKTKKWLKKVGLFLVGPVVILAIIFAVEMSGGRIGSELNVTICLLLGVTPMFSIFYGETKNVKIWLVVAIAIIVFAATVWPTPYKYLNIQDNKLLKINRLTGQTFMFYPNSGWLEQE